MTSTILWRRRAARLAALAPMALMAGSAHADTGDTAWILTSTALVLFMTLPGLALFYGGLVRAQNVLSVFIQCFAIACLVSILWLALGYSLAFGDGNGDADGLGQLVGGLAKTFLSGVEADTMSGSIPESLFFMFQMTFAIITPALIVGAFVERVKFSAVLCFTAPWLLLVYAPVCHWVWGGGWLADLGVRDFAGGLVVHATAGVSALVFVIMLGPRQTFMKEMHPPHNPAYVAIGAAMLWVGWFGFNGGSALAANGDAARAMIVTHLSAATAAFVWMLVEWIQFRKPTLVGVATGMVAGLATITPAAGSVGPAAAVLIGAVAALVCYYAVVMIRSKLKIDDSLDVFAVHGVGGILGTLILPLLANFGPMAPTLDGQTVASAFGVQLLGVVSVCAWSVIVSVLILIPVDSFIGLRVDASSEEQGLDVTTHGETAYP